MLIMTKLKCWMMELLYGPNSEILTWKRVGEQFYLQPDVLLIAKQLIGKKLVSCINNQTTAGIITETEAYAGETDLASHSFGGRRTRRTETMYGRGGSAYIYLCYGIHSLFNVVTNQQGIPHAVLIRGIYPVNGLEFMFQRIGHKPDLKKEGTGPGKVTKLLGLDYLMDGTDLLKSELIWIEESGFGFNPDLIRNTARIGVDYAGEDAMLPYRFIITHRDAHQELKKAGHQ